MLSPLAAHLLLLRLPDTGTASYWQLMEVFASPQELLNLPARSLAPYLKPVAIEALADYQANPHSHLARLLATDLAYLDAQPSLHCLLFDDPRYPRLLREIPKPPPLLFVRGNPDCLSLPQLAIVGSRSPSGGGNENAERFAAYLAGCGLAITSGLALGIDAAAHRGALSAGGITIAVMGTGIDRIYPSRHHQLAQAIVDGGGALVSEFPLGTSSHASHFPQRNRIISGLSGGTLVVEAAVQSGSLITASYALQHNREVFAIPGSIHNPLARGCHQLIRQGATLVETAQDIVDQLSGLISYKRQELSEASQRDDFFQDDTSTTTKATPPAAKPPVAPPSLSAQEQQLLQALGYDPLPLDLLAERIGQEVGALSAALIGLEIKGLVQQVGASYQRC
ncbi:DNA-processing protein DprA [Cellvibrio sp. PSBB023]|uniref:DNA-processing protein DprA n=1 Tax=Cellvibrio sp. PSBB023 TaxID=1945512 RepID=UPI00098F867F|nr:DNA-processing protein DprA [Cellvibrio sp. PSBB023]AQT61010.1 DNA protecting protein DprA [Cellvibrio sp. PSBB023]